MIDPEKNTPFLDEQVSSRLDDLSTFFGALNYGGNIVSANGANLFINKSLGKTYRRSSNYETNRKSPDITTDVNQSPITGTTLIGYQDGAGGFSYDLYSAITPNDYDDGSGTKATVGNNKFTIQRVYFFNETDTFAIYLGQTEYQSLDSAIADLDTEIRVIDSAVSLATHRSSIVVKKGTTALNDVALAYFHNEPNLQGGGGGSAASIVNVQRAYNASVSPEVLTDAIRGAFTVKEGTGTGINLVYEGQDNAGTVTFSVDGNGKVIASSIVIGNGATGTFTTVDSKTVTNGVITNIV